MSQPAAEPSLPDGATAPQCTAALAAVLWDMDGTLIDTEEHWIAAEQELMESFGKSWSEQDGLALVGQELTTSARMMKERTGLPLTEEEIVSALLDRVIAAVTRALPWRPGALELHAQLRAARIPMALVTMSYGRFARPVADALGNGGFDVIVAGDDVERGKPDPEAYLKAARELGVPITSCVALEDSPAGLASALGAGARTVGVRNLVPIERAPGLSRVSSLTELSVPILSQIAAGQLVDTLG